LHVIFTGFSSAIADVLCVFFFFTLSFQFHVTAGVSRGDGMHIYFFLLRFPHDLRFHDIFSRLMPPATCNDKTVKAGVDGVIIMGQC
jgi:hypothetical protein